MRFRGAELIGLPSNRIARLGIAYCPEERGIFASLDVEENLLLPPQVCRGGLSVAAIFVYHFAAWSPAGWIWPASVAYFTAAAGPRVRWVIAIGVAQLVYSAVAAGWIINSNLSRYLIHTVGEGLLFCALVYVASRLVVWLT